MTVPPPSDAPKYSQTLSAPTKSMNARLSGTGHGAAACTTILSDDRSYAVAHVLGELEDAR